MNWLADQLVDTTQNIKYPNLAEVELDEKGKPTRSWMWKWSQEERTSKFFEFCRAYDMREDSLLKYNYQQFSHRLHWDECPFVDEAKQMNDPQTLLEACLLFSFTNEHWQTFRTWREGGIDAMRKRFLTERHARSDLFQIYYPKDTNVKEWLCEVPKDFAEKYTDYFFANRISQNRPYTMMEMAKKLNEIFVRDYGFRNAMYPCKNAARHIAMSTPNWVDPESFLHGGTGFFDGLVQVFDCPQYMSKAKYEIGEDGRYIPINTACHSFYDKMLYLYEHGDNPIVRQKYLNLEDKLCFFYKHIAITNGIKDTTKQIPYDWVYPSNWSLKTGQYDTQQSYH
jgi:hypothetical protein